MSASLPISNVITISVSAASAGAGAYNTSNLAIFTDEAPNLATFGSAGYAQYLTPTQVGIDFGTSSRTYGMANAIFSQQPNILNGGGQLVVYLLTNQIVNIALSGVAASGTFELVYNANATAAINWNDTAAMIQTKLQAVAGLSTVLVTGSIASESLNIQMAGIYAPTAITSTSNSLETSGSASITLTITIATAAQTITQAITASQGVVNYFGFMVNQTVAEVGSTDLLATAAIAQALNIMGFFVSHTLADIAPTTGMLWKLQSGGFSHTRGLYYGDTNYLNAINMMAAYAGRALSTNFNGSNTTGTMHLQPLVGIFPDPTMTQTILNEAVAAGADTYISFQQGPNGVFTSGLNVFFDQAYGTIWFSAALQIAGFNYLAQTSTKVPQTENGMDGLKAAYGSICAQAVTNQFAAPGAWNSATYFGNPTLLVNNIAQLGYYIYSTPISQQLQTARAARQAPLVQIALKLAGAIQSSTVTVIINP